MHCFFTTHTNLFFHCLHVDVKISYVIVYPITLTCFIIVYTITITRFVIVYTIKLTCFVIVYTLTSDSFPRGGCAARRPSLRPSCGKAAPESESAPEQGAAVQHIILRGGGQTIQKLTTSYNPRH